jgi:hypothetical protein
MYKTFGTGRSERRGSGVRRIALLATIAWIVSSGCHQSTKQEPINERVVVTTPRAGASFTAGDEIVIEATAHTEAPVRRMEFWLNQLLIGTREGPPYRTTMRKVPAGTHRVYAVAHTATGRIASPHVAISVRMREEDREREPTPEDMAMLMGGADPRIFIDAPAPGTTLRAPADIIIEGWAVFPAADMKSIVVLGDGKQLTTFTTSRFKHVWRGVGKGRHVVVIRAIDAEGRTMQQSETVSVQ